MSPLCSKLFNAFLSHLEQDFQAPESWPTDLWGKKLDVRNYLKYKQYGNP